MNWKGFGKTVVSIYDMVLAFAWWDQGKPRWSQDVWSVSWCLYAGHPECKTGVLSTQCIFVVLWVSVQAAVISMYWITWLVFI